MSPDMADVFISHIEAEKPLAAALEWLSRDQFDPKPSVRREIQDCKGFVAMYSNGSFQSHWVHVESGAAWGLGKRVIPVCYGGKTKGSLPRPYSSFQAIDLVDSYQLIIAVSDALGRLCPPPPGIYFSGQKFERGLRYKGNAYERVIAELIELYPDSVRGKE